MILGDIYKYLQTDTGLTSALEATLQDSKIYPNFARISSRAPYIVYRSANPGGSPDEVLSNEQAVFVITSDNFAKTVQISAVLTELLDLPNANIPSQEYNIYYCKKTGGSDYVDELGRHARALNFTLKFKKR